MAQNHQAKFQLTSPAFSEDAEIPLRYTCRGDNVNPPLIISGLPPNAQSLALIMHDPDAVKAADFLHWLMWDMPTSTETINANSVPVGAVQGMNDAGKKGYLGPCPPAGSGTHRYMFELYALDNTLSLPEGTTRQQLEQAMADHQLAHYRLTGLFKAEDAA